MTRDRPRRARSTALRRGLAVLLSLLGCGACLGAPLPLLAQEPPPGFEQGLFEVRVGTAPPAVAAALVNERGGVLLPLLPLLGAAGLPFTLGPDTSSVAVPVLGGGEAVLDLASRRLRLPDRTVEVAADEVLKLGSDVYLGTDPVALLLGSTVTADFGNLSVVLRRDPPFPAEQRALIEARRAVLLRNAGERAAQTRIAYPPRSGAGVLDWSLGTTGLSSFVPRSTLRLGAGAALLGGSVSLGQSFVFAPEGVSTLGDRTLSYRRVLPDHPLVRQLQLGDVIGGGVQARAFRGISFTNSETRPEIHFGALTVSPPVPPGWEYEVYQGERLIGFSDPARPGPVTVPLQYGTTLVRVRMFGPAGEEVVSDLRYQVPFAQLARGRWEYAAGGGACTGEECRLYSFVDVRHGLTRWITLGGGANRLQDSTGVRIQPHGTVALASPGGWSLELRGLRDAFVRGAVRYLGGGPAWFAVGGGLSHPGAGELSLAPQTARRWDLELNSGLRAPSLPDPFRTLQLAARLEGEARGEVDRVSVSAISPTAYGYLEASYESNLHQRADLVSLRATALVPQRAPAWLRGNSVSGRAAVSGAALRQLEASTSFRVGPVSELSVSAAWTAGFPRPGVSIGYSTVRPFARLHARAFAPSKGRTAASLSADGAVTFGGSKGVTSLPGEGTGTAGVSGRVFRDHDGDGRLGPGDEPLPGATVLVGGLQAASDSLGRFAAWEVTPYEVTAVRLDTVNLADPSWIPLRREELVRPTPHLYNRVDIALVQTRELSGRLVPGEGVATVAGVTLEIRETSTGERSTVSTFADGEFYVSRIRPGEYELRVAESSLRALSSRTDPGVLRFTIPARGEDPVVELPPLRIVRLGTPP